MSAKIRPSLLVCLHDLALSQMNNSFEQACCMELLGEVIGHNLAITFLKLPLIYVPTHTPSSLFSHTVL